MDFDAFVDELELTLGCKGQGYIKCLKLVKSLKEDNGKLYKENDHLYSLVGEDVEAQAKKYRELYINYMNTRVENTKLKEENEKLKEWDKKLLKVLSDYNKLNDKNIELKEENEKLKKEIEDLNGGIDAIQEERGIMEDYMLEYKEENKQLKELAGVGDGRQTYKQYYEQHTQEIKGLKNTIINNEEQHKLNMLEAKFNTWREVMCQYDSQYSLDDEIIFLNENSDNQEHIKKIFEKLYEGEYGYDIHTQMYYDEEEEDEEQKQMDEFIDNVLTTMKICKN